MSAIAQALFLFPPRLVVLNANLHWEIDSVRLFATCWLADVPWKNGPIIWALTCVNIKNFIIFIPIPNFFFPMSVMQSGGIWSNRSVDFCDKTQQNAYYMGFIAYNTPCEHSTIVASFDTKTEYISIYLYIYTVETLYSTINFCWNTHKRHSIARPKGRGMGCLLWVQRATYCVDLSILSSIKYLLW